MNQREAIIRDYIEYGFLSNKYAKHYRKFHILEKACLFTCIVSLIILLLNSPEALETWSFLLDSPVGIPLLDLYWVWWGFLASLALLFAAKMLELFIFGGGEEQFDRLLGEIYWQWHLPMESYHAHWARISLLKGLDRDTREKVGESLRIPLIARNMDWKGFLKDEIEKKEEQMGKAKSQETFTILGNPDKPPPKLGESPIADKEAALSKIFAYLGDGEPHWQSWDENNTPSDKQIAQWFQAALTGAPLDMGKILDNSDSTAI